MVLIIYMTKTGTTKETADIINEVLIKEKFDVEVLKISEVDSIEKYEMIIIGGPINGMRWLPQISTFLEDNQSILNNKKVACFAFSIISDGRKFWKKRIHKNFKKSYDSIKPIETAIFGGKIDQPMTGLPRLIFGLPKGSPLDYTNHDMVKNWSKKLIEGLN